MYRSHASHASPVKLEPYKLIPEKTGEGRGSRRRYSFHKLLQIDVANALSRKSRLLSSEMIVAAVQLILITEDLISRWANSFDAEGNAPAIVLAFDGAGWEVLGKEDCTADFNESLENGDIWISFNFGVLLGRNTKTN